MSRRAIAVRLLVWPLIVILLINGWLYLQQPRLTFGPFAELEATPAKWGFAYEDVQLKTVDGVTLHGWYLPSPAATKTLLFLHGSGGNISHRSASLAIFHRLGLNVLILDYRGYGKSGGEPSEEGLYSDAMAAWDYLTRECAIDASQIIIFGRSLGGAVAADLASRVEPAAVILESTFSSAEDMAGHLFPLLSHIVVLRYRFDSIGKIAQLNSPVLIMHSPDDEVVPYRLGRKLYSAAVQPKRFVKLQGDHNGGFILSQPGYERALRKFIAEVNGMPDGSLPIAISVGEH